MSELNFLILETYSIGVLCQTLFAVTQLFTLTTEV